MRFSEYFNSWLYGKYGYYTNYKSIGKDGDFFTSVSTSKFFGGSIAKKIIPLLKGKKDIFIIEIGAHYGYLLADIIEFIYTLDKNLLKQIKFGIVERFEELQKIQKEYFYKSFGNEIKLYHFKDLKEISSENIVFVANEIFDAFSCELIYNNQQAYVKNHKIYWDTITDDIRSLVEKYNISKGEVSIGFEEFANSMYNSAKNIDFITFDYGEKYARGDFSIRIYKKHKTYPLFDDINLEEFYKNSDITYDVNFLHLIDSFNKFELVSYSTQLKALIDFGILELLEMLKDYSYDLYQKEIVKTKLLLDPTMGFGERFKMCHFRKN